MNGVSLLLLQVLSITTMSTSYTPCNISFGAYSALEALYYSTNGAEWSWNENLPEWSFPSALAAPCSEGWQGLTCSFYEDELGSEWCNITAVALSNLNLVGSLPTELGLLEAVTSIDLSENFITGRLPTELGQLQHLTSLDLDTNQIHSSIPPQLFLATRLESIVLFTNYISGSLPSEIGYLTNLTILSIYDNLITGVLPFEVNISENLQVFWISLNYFYGDINAFHQFSLTIISININNNYFSGSIPTSFSYASELIELEVGVNLMTGTIPTEIAHLVKLTQLDLSQNFFTGTLPSELGALQTLRYLYVINCFLSGTVPTELGRLSLLEILAISSDCLTGRIPSEVGMLSALNALLMIDNYFTGVIPDTFSSLQDLNSIALYENLLTGTLPTFLGNWVVASAVYFYNNFFTGSIPSDIVNMVILQQLDLGVNFFEGSIPSFIRNLTSIQQITLQSNLFSGTIPIEIAGAELLESFDFSSNEITGRIPSELAAMQFLRSLSLVDNLLTNSIPSEISQLRLLQNFNISSNALSVSSEFLASLPPQLAVLDLSMNLLTGSLPDTMFQSSLKVLSLYSNCFTGSLPSSICEAKQLRTVVLDSLTSAPGCEVDIPPWLRRFIGGKLPRRFMSGSIPTCLWSLPNLTTFHISGNGLTGALVELPASSMLIDLSVSNNNLKGAIPLSFQVSDKYQQLDLSSNHLSGTLSSSFVANQSTTSLNLAVNRLSGLIPVGLKDLTTISILEGNLFQCDSASLPTHDKDSKSYVCGSDNLNASLIVWVVAFAVTVAVAYLIVFLLTEDYRVPIQQLKISFLDVSRCLISSTSLLAKKLNIHNSLFMRTLVVYPRCCLWLAVVYVCVTLPSYLTMKLNPRWTGIISTHTEQYMWVTSAGFLHGAAPATLILLYVCGSVMFVWGCKVPVINHTSNNSEGSLVKGKLSADVGLNGNFVESDRKDTNDYSNYVIKWRKWAQFVHVAAMITVHVVVVLVVNIAYVFAYLSGLPAVSLLLVQIGVSVFKLVWSQFIVRWGGRQLSHLNAGTRVVLFTSFLLFTFLAGPFLATFFTDASCFRYVITMESATSSAFPVEQFLCFNTCQTSVCYFYCQFSTDDIEYTSTTVVPGWLYSYQCSSSLLVDYVPVLVLSFAISGIISPAFRMLSVLVNLETHLPHSLIRFLPSSYLSNSNKTDSFAHSFAVCCLFRNLTVVLTFGLASPLLAVLAAVDGVVIVMQWSVILSNEAPACRSHTSTNNPITSIDMNSYHDESSAEQASTSVEIPSSLDSSISHQQLSTASSPQPLDDVFAASLIGFNRALGLCIGSVALFWSIFVFDMIADVYGNSMGGVGIGALLMSILLAILVTSLLNKYQDRLRNALFHCAESSQSEGRSHSVVVPGCVHSVKLEEGDGLGVTNSSQQSIEMRTRSLSSLPHVVSYNDSFT